ncbi:MAG: MBL fold metallo-hydrolase [Pseudomonadota bacterium]
MAAQLTSIGVKGGPAIRPGSNMPTSFLLRLSGKNIVVDAGLGVTRGVCDAGVALDTIDLVFITHLHSDHYIELGPLIHTAWTAGLRRPIPVIGPRGLASYWAAFLQSMSFDIELRMEDEGRVQLAELCAHQVIGQGAIFRDGGLTVCAMRNVHPPIHESFALRFEFDGRAIVLSGDTAFMPEMIAFASGADMLVHEAMLPDGVDALCRRMKNGDARLRAHILRSHTSAEAVGRIARDAKVKHLVLNHFVPDGDPDFGDAQWMEAVQRSWDGPTTLGRDGLTIDI